jgi:hypothetical protein
MDHFDEACFTVYIGIDWVDAKHDFCLQAAGGTHREFGVFSSQAAHIDEWMVHLPHQLLGFRHNYIPLADLARAMDKKASVLSRLLSGIELVGAKPLPDSGMRGGLIRMADLGRLAVLCTRAGTDLSPGVSQYLTRCFSPYVRS